MARHTRTNILKHILVLHVIDFLGYKAKNIRPHSPTHSSVQWTVGGDQNLTKNQ